MLATFHAEVSHYIYIMVDTVLSGRCLVTYFLWAFMNIHLTEDKRNLQFLDTITQTERSVVVDGCFASVPRHSRLNRRPTYLVLFSEGQTNS